MASRPELAARPPYSCVLFDLDGVLFETQVLAARARQIVARVPAPSGPDYRAEYARLVRKDARIVDPATAGVIHDLAERRVRLGVVTSSPSAWARILLDGIGCRSRFGCLIGAEAVRNPKPEPDGLLLALRRLGKTPGETVYVGHEETDEEAARRAGVSFARAAWAGGHGARTGLVLENMRQLLTLCGRGEQEPDEP